uniref:Ig-like domain-containing protein n=1 Tax=Tetranychus urticae TaxID=32264 RepID=T1K7R1_TETUR
MKLNNLTLLLVNLTCQLLTSPLIIILSTCAVHIKHFSFPSTFDLTRDSTLTLDCDYAYNENDLLLVVRWFHQSLTDRPDPIYQWIPERQVRHVAADYKSSFDYEHVSDASDPFTMYRSVVLHQPVPTMSGKYKCLISSLANSDSREGNVFIYASPRSFIFTSRVDPDTGNLLLKCITRQVYPLPQVNLYKYVTSSAVNTFISKKATSTNSTIKQTSESSYSSTIPLINVNKSISLPSPYYDVSIEYTLNEQELLATVFNRIPTIFECRVTINNTDYSSTKRITLYSMLEKQLMKKNDKRKSHFEQVQ